MPSMFMIRPQEGGEVGKHKGVWPRVAPEGGPETEECVRLSDASRNITDHIIILMWAILMWA